MALIIFMVVTVYRYLYTNEPLDTQTIIHFTIPWEEPADDIHNISLI